jgi:hypothetical protein
MHCGARATHLYLYYALDIPPSSIDLAAGFV